MNQIEVAIGQYTRTILELSGRVAQAAVELSAAQEEIARLTKELGLKPPVEEATAEE